MTEKRFYELRGEIDQLCAKLLKSKGQEYIQGREDRLINFKEDAQAAGTSAEIVWLIFFLKQVHALSSAIRTGETLSESMESRFVDARNYIDLGYALMVEKLEDTEVDPRNPYGQ